MFNPQYVITNKMLVLVGRIEAAREVVEGGSWSAEWEMRFKQDALIRSIFATLELDGARVGRNEVEKIVAIDAGRDERAEEVALRAGVVAKEKEVQAVINRQSAMKYTEQLIRLAEKTGLGSYGEKEMMQIHSLLMEKILPSHQVGVFRTAGVEEKDLFFGINKTVPLSIEISYQLEDFWRWFKSLAKTEIYPAIKSAIVIVEIVRMMPFAAGNAVTAFVFSQLVLGIEGLGFKRMSAVEFVLTGKENELRQKLIETINQSDLTSWIEFWLEVVAVEVEELKIRLKRLGGEVLVPQDRRGRQLSLSERQIALMEAFQTREELTMNEARSILPSVSDDTILRDLTVLLKKKLIRKRGKTKASKYILLKAVL